MSPMDRWVIQAVTGRPPARAPRRRSNSRGPARNWRYRAWVRTLPCASCGRQDDTVEAAHTGSDGGMAQKASDYSVIPLCPDCHTMAPDSYHRDRKAFEERIGCKDLVRSLNHAWFAYSEMIK